MSGRRSSRRRARRLGQLRGAFVLTQAMSSADIAGQRHTTPSTNLPTPPPALIGREREIEQICALLRTSEVRLVTLTGPGGIGKTRLGLQAATELLGDFPDGAWLVELARLGKAAPEWHAPQRSAWYKQLVAEQDNLRAALQWAVEHPAGDIAVRLACALAQDRAAERALAHAWLLFMQGQVAWFQGNIAVGQAAFEESLAPFRDLHDIIRQYPRAVQYGCLRTGAWRLRAGGAAPRKPPTVQRAAPAARATYERAVATSRPAWRGRLRGGMGGWAIANVGAGHRRSACSDLRQRQSLAGLGFPSTHCRSKESYRLDP